MAPCLHLCKIWFKNLVKTFLEKSERKAGKGMPDGMEWKVEIQCLKTLVHD